MHARKWWGLRLRPQRFSPKLLLAFFAVLAAALAQDASFLSPDVIRVGAKLACRCGGCRNTVGDCPMIRCSSADPLRHRIYNMKAKGMSDGDIVNSIVRAEGIVALASPPAAGLGPIVTWVMPGLVLVIGFFVYSAFVRRHRKEPAPLSEVDEKLIERFRAQIDSELEESDGEPRRDAGR
jgi:cytochrome c-type biogenesis protein CcmH/NrfF